MRIRIPHLVAAAPLVLFATPGHAQQAESTGDAAMGLILAGHHDTAESQLLAQLRANPDQPALLLNLAAVYTQTGRHEAARATYRRVLDADELWLERANGGIADSHTLARRGLAQLEHQRIAQR